jgi:hypothetical protein
MPLHQSGPFQSRILRRVVQWAQTWTNRAQVSWRSLKTTASWTAQVLVYPIYAAFQAVRLVNLRLQQARSVNITRKAAQHTHHVSLDTGTAVAVELNPTCDTPIYQLLETVRVMILPALPGWQQTLILIKGDLWNSQGLLPAHNQEFLLAESSAITKATIMQPQPYAGALVPVGAIRGFASILSTRSLVLVTERNTLLDILSPAQQQYLRHQIAWEVARLLRLRRLKVALTRLGYVPQPNASAHRLVRAFLWLMQWMATTPVAIAANLFDEAEVNRLPASEVSSPSSTSGAIAHNAVIFDQSAQVLTETYSQEQTNAHFNILEDKTALTPVGNDEVILQSEQTPLLSRNSDYIDTPATLVGYVQSPIKKLLRWLDRCIFWVENLVVNLWRQLRS